MPEAKEEYCRGLPYIIPVAPLEDLRGAKRIVVQVPPGLRPYLDRLGECVRERVPGAEIILQLDPVYGACDLAYPQLHSVAGADTIIHVGHTPYPRDLASRASEPQGVRVVYLPAYSMVAPSESLIAEAVSIVQGLEAGRVAVVSTAQHLHQLESVASILEEMGLEARIPRGFPPFFGDGQVIGCDYRVALRVKDNVDAFLFVGGGRFHPLGLYLATRLPVVVADPYQGVAYNMTVDGEKVLKSRMYRVMRALDARRISIIVGLKTGQHRPWLVSVLVGLAQRRGVDALVFASDRLSLEDLRSMPPTDAIVVTSCPRLPIDDFSRHEIPVLTPGEARMALTGRLDPYLFPW